MLVVALNRSECDTIASHRGDARQARDADGVPSLVFRGSILQSISFADNRPGSAGSRPSTSSEPEDVESSSCSPVHASKP